MTDIYIFDTCSIRGLQHIHPDNFPSLWHDMELLVIFGTVVSVREVYKELEIQGIPDFLKDWASDNRKMFHSPTEEEAQFLLKMLSKKRFKSILSKKAVLESRPFADPFLIAKAYCIKGTIVTEESNRPNSVKIPTICEYYGIDCINLKQFMDIRDWHF
jgi:hypothetical protein